MANTIQCDIVSAEEALYSGEATMVIASGEEGELGITPRHAQLITRLRPGQVRVLQANGEEEFLYISGGILEVQPHRVTVLADTAIRAHDLDEAAALKAKEEAERALAEHDHEVDFAEAQAKLMQATAQLAALARLRRSISR